MQRSRPAQLAILLLIASVGCHRRGATPSDATSAIGRDEVWITSGGVRLAATITRPADDRRHPGIVVLHAAGLERRADYRIFADSLASHGIVVLAYDMRGTGDSEGQSGLPNFQQLSQDARAALRLLRAQTDVDAEKVGLWALSRGGYTAPIVAVADPSVRFLIVIGSPGFRVGRSDSMAWVDRAKENELAAGDIARYERFIGLLLQAARTGGADYDRLEQQYEDLRAQPWFPSLFPSLPSEEVWIRFGRVHAFDPDSVWRRVEVPTLLIYGGRDAPRLVRDSRKRILSALAAAGAPVDAPVYPSADHLMVVGRGGNEVHFPADFFVSQARWIAENT